MQTFDFPYHRVVDQYPENNIRVKLGQGYTFTAASEAPDQRIFSLTLVGMQFFVDSNGTLNKTTTPQRNVEVLRAFYETHKLHLTFLYDHPALGTLSVKFNKPLEIPAAETGGSGVINSMTVELIEQP